MKKIQYYESLTDDLIADGKEHKLKEGYKWLREGVGAKILSALTYALAVIFGWIYARLVLHMRISGKEKLKGTKGGYFIYGNHTQPIGDVVLPGFAAFPKRIYTVVSPANLALPVIGRLLPYLGALPIDGTLKGTRELNRAIEKKILEGHSVVIYPEAHVWHYYTGIRPFPDTSFTYPVRLGVPAFAFTVTYTKRRLGKRPRLNINIDGPFYPDRDLGRAASKELAETVRKAMASRAEKSDTEYIKYIQKSAK